MTLAEAIGGFDPAGNTSDFSQWTIEADAGLEYEVRLRGDLVKCSLKSKGTVIIVR